VGPKQIRQKSCSSEVPVSRPIVQAKCPRCLKDLRIPLDWLNRPLRCKSCQFLFQARAKG